jgi:hypothetical protein
MKPQSRLNSQGQEQQQQGAEQQGQHSAAQEFATVEEMLRHDAEQTPVPPAIAQRLQESLNEAPAPPQSWWRRFLRGL